MIQYLSKISSIIIYTFQIGEPSVISDPHVKIIHSLVISFILSPFNFFANITKPKICHRGHKYFEEIHARQKWRFFYWNFNSNLILSRLYVCKDVEKSWCSELIHWLHCEIIKREANYSWINNIASSTTCKFLGNIIIVRIIWQS